MNYEEALRLVDIQRSRDGVEVNPLCRCELMSHGHKTARAILFLHGYTNCPQQFHDLGRSFFERGYNVFNPRLPYHGLADRLTPKLGRLNVQELITYANEAVDIGRGLGDHVTLAGISANGVVAAWAAQHRAEVDRAVIISPSFAVGLLPSFLIRPFAQLGSRLPPMFIWWDQRVRENTSPAYAYPRFATRSLAHVIRLGLMVRKAAKQSKPLAGTIILITNANDPAVDNHVAHHIADLWERHGARVVRYEFEAGLKLAHDIIDPNQPRQQVAITYPKLIELMD
jgi:carboxylesterase